MSRYINVEEVNSILGASLENVKDDISPSYYAGAKFILDKINDMASNKPLEIIEDEPQKEDAYAYDEDDWYDKTEREGE